MSSAYVAIGTAGEYKRSMLETLIMLAILPFAIATLLSLAATGYLIISSGWKWLLFLLAAGTTLVAYAIGSEWWVLFILVGFALGTFLYAIGGFDEPTTVTKNLQD